jgi:hypothetical protein
MAATQVDWEGRTYRIDLVTPEQRRLTRALEQMGALPIRVALDLERLSTKLSAQSVALADVRASIGELKKIAPLMTPKDKRTAITPPPGVDASKYSAETINKAVQDLSKISQPKDVKKAVRSAEPLFLLSDELLAQALMSLTYALDIGNPEGTTLMGGDVSRRHDFGFARQNGDRRIRSAWAAPIQMASFGLPWHVEGSLLGLDSGLASLALRRIDTGEVPQAPVLTVPDRDTFVKTVGLMNPFDLTDAGRDAIVAAIGRGRSRVTAIAKDPAGWDEAADQIRLDGWRRRAGQWATVNDAALVPTYFSLLELVHLGAPPDGLPLDQWGMASDASDACLCTEAPLPGRPMIVTGRPHLGLLASEVADVNLRVAEALASRHLPAALARGVLAGAVQDYLDQVRPLHPNDWLALVRTAQAIPDDRIEDYIAALTADGPLAPARPTGAGDRSQR